MAAKTNFLNREYQRKQKRFASPLLLPLVRSLTGQPLRGPVGGRERTGANSPFEVVSNLIGTCRAPGSIACFMGRSIDQAQMGGEYRHPSGHAVKVTETILVVKGMR